MDLESHYSSKPPAIPKPKSDPSPGDITNTQMYEPQALPSPFEAIAEDNSIHEAFQSNNILQSIRNGIKDQVHQTTWQVTLSTFGYLCLLTDPAPPGGDTYYATEVDLFRFTSKP